jgi:DNA-binding MarR family transcriptional regulator
METPMETPDGETIDDDRFRAVIYQLLQVSGLMLRTREHYAAAVGVTPPQFSILTAVHERPGSSVGDVAARLHVSGPFVTAEANKLVDKGLLVRASAAHDRRVSELSVTEDCARRLAAVAPVRQGANETIFGRLSPEEVEAFSASLVALLGGLDEALRVLDRPGEGPG